MLDAGSPILSAARGRNAEESQAAQSRRADFSSKLSIACKEAREMHYGLRLLAASDIVGEPRLAELLDEADQLIASSSQSPRK